MKKTFRTFKILNQEYLNRAIEALSVFTEIGLDIEVANYQYGVEHERISTIQMAGLVEGGIGEYMVYVIDCFQELDLAALSSILSNNKILKVIHNASYDANKLPFHLGLEVTPVWCTLTAERKARPGARGGNSLQECISRHFNENISKKERDSDWSRRPLTAAQWNYAAQDAVLHLRLYRQQLKLGFNGYYNNAYRANTQPLFNPVELPSLEHSFMLREKRDWLRKALGSRVIANYPDQCIWFSNGLYTYGDLPGVARKLEEWATSIIEGTAEPQGEAGCVPGPSHTDCLKLIEELHLLITRGVKPNNSAHFEASHAIQMLELEEILNSPEIGKEAFRD